MALQVIGSLWLMMTCAITFLIELNSCTLFVVFFYHHLLHAFAQGLLIRARRWGEGVGFYKLASESGMCTGLGVRVPQDYGALCSI